MLGTFGTFLDTVSFAFHVYPKAHFAPSLLAMVQLSLGDVWVWDGKERDVRGEAGLEHPRCLQKRCRLHNALTG